LGAYNSVSGTILLKWFKFQNRKGILYIYTKFHPKSHGHPKASP